MLGTLRLTICALLAALLAPAGAFAHPDHALVGGAQTGPGEVAIAGVLDGRRDRIAFGGITVTINGMPAELGRDGHFAATVPIAPYYRLDIAGERIFAMVQTFGNEELHDGACECFSIPPIELVARKKGRIELFFGGDSMAGRRYFKPMRGERALLHPGSLAADLDALLAPMKPYIQTSDWASINLETVLADDQPGPPLANKRITFFSPTEYAQALKRAGVDYVTLGNNHIYDYGEAGVTSTIAALEKSGLAYSGAGHSESEAGREARVDLPKNRLSLLGFVGWEGSGGAHQTANEMKGGAAFGTRGQVRRSVRAIKAEGRTPIVQYHGGAEYIDRPSATTIGRLREAVDHGAPLAIGHHPHLVQGVEVYRDSLIAPSIGNFMFDQNFARTQTSYVIKAWLEKGRFIRAEIVPISVLDYRPIPAVGSAREASLRRLFGLSAERGTNLVMSGGHAVVRPGEAPSQPLCRRPDGDFRLATFSRVCGATAGLSTGRNLIARSTFEQARMYGAWERLFGAANAAFEFTGAPSQEHVILRPEDDGRPFAFYTQGYLRDVAVGEYTMRARVKLPVSARIDFLVKKRPEKGQKPSARWRGEVLGSVELSASSEWQELQFDFSRSDQGQDLVRSFRPILLITPNQPSGSIHPIAIDDFELIHWSEEFSPAQAWLASHARPQPAPGASRAGAAE